MEREVAGNKEEETGRAEGCSWVQTPEQTPRGGLQGEGEVSSREGRALSGTPLRPRGLLTLRKGGRPGIR